MILKLIGSVMILVSGTMLGVKMGYNLKMRLSQLKRFEKIISMLTGEIRYNNSTIPEALNHVGAHMVNPFNEILMKISEELDAFEGRTFKEIWENAFEENRTKLCFTKEQLENIKHLGESLGYLDKQMQINTLDLFMEQIRTDIKDMEKTISDNVRLYNCLGVMGGILVILIIV